MRLRLALLLAAAFAIAAPAARQVAPLQNPAGAQLPGAQQPPPPVTTGLILGQAVDGTSGKPLGGVTVTLSSFSPIAVPPNAPPGTVIGPTLTRVITDTQGHFLFADLPKGSFNLTATKPGYVSGAYGRRSPSGASGSQSLVLAEGERKGDVSISLWKYASISGTVLDEFGEPIIGLQVRVLRRTIVGGKRRYSESGNMPVTDDRGVFRIATLTPGDYVAAIVSAPATVPVSVREAYNQALRTGAFTDYMRELAATGVSSLPLANSGVPVGSLLLTSGSSGRSGLSAPGPLPAEGRRIYVYPTLFYPTATSAAQATVITIGSGEERTNVDFQLKPVPTSRVSGVITGPAGSGTPMAVTLLPAGSDDFTRDIEAATTASDASGAFTFLGVTPGQYVARVLTTPKRPVSDSGFTSVIQVGSSTIMSGGGPSTPPPIPQEPTLSASAVVTVGDTDVTGVALDLHPGARISGRVEFDGTAEKPTPDRLQQVFITIDPANGRQFSSFLISRAQLDANGMLSSYQMPPGRYVIRPGGFPGWTFKSAMFDGHDIADVPVELGGTDVTGVVLTYTDHPSELAGTARDEKGSGDPAAVVLVFPADHAAWLDYGSSARRLRSARAGKDGAYKFTGLPAGDYLVTALREEQAVEWTDPRTLTALAATANRVTIGDGEKKSQDVRTVVVR